MMSLTEQTGVSDWFSEGEKGRTEKSLQ